MLPGAGRVAEVHRGGRTGWLRAGVLGANDGLLSTASLIVGVAASGSSRSSILISGVAGLVAGAMSMAAGEYVSVSSQADMEKADLARERFELASDEPAERAELAAIYVARGLTPALASCVAEQLMAKDALGAHARDELGLTHTSAARPVQAALVSALAFSVGALLPVIVAAVAPRDHASVLVTGSALGLLALLGVVAALIGGATAWRGALRMTILGLLAMGVSAAIGRLVGGAV